MPDTFRTYSVSDEDKPTKVYYGFNRNYDPIELDYVILVTVDGELDVWALDSPQLIGDLFNYLSDQEAGIVKPIGCYERLKDMKHNPPCEEGRFYVAKRDGLRDRCYQGFNKDYEPIALNYVVIVESAEGEIDVWALEKPYFTDGLMEYLTEYACSGFQVIGTYARV